MTVERVRVAGAPDLSVVVPSVPDYDHERTVDCLADQQFDGRYEVLVVEDGSIDRCEARNRGLEAARAPVVALTDDDTRPPPDWLSAAATAFESAADLVCLEGPVYGGARYGGTRHYVGCNLAVDREAALAVGGFDSDYAVWREDTEFGWRMERDAGGRCAFSPQFRMCHPTVPRTPLDPPTERRLREAYPDRYGEILGTGPVATLRRTARARGITSRIERARNRLRRAVGLGGC